MTALSDAEDAPPGTPGARYFDENAKTLRPPPEKVAEINAALVKHESERVAEFLGKLDARLDGLATKEDVAALRGGVAMALAGIEAIAQDVADIKAAIGGEGGLAQKIDGLNHGVGGALDGLAQVKRLARATYDGVFHGSGAVNDEERAACEAIK